MTQRYHTNRTVYRGAVEHMVQYGDSPTPDETWPVDYSDERKFATLHAHEEIVASVGAVVELSETLDAVERLCPSGGASLSFPSQEEAEVTLTIYPGDVPTVRRALDAIEREWRRLGVYDDVPDGPASSPAGQAGGQAPDPASSWDEPHVPVLAQAGAADAVTCDVCGGALVPREGHVAGLPWWRHVVDGVGRPVMNGPDPIPLAIHPDRPGDL